MMMVMDRYDVDATEVRGGTLPQRKQQRQRQATKTKKLFADPRIVGGTPAAPGAYPFYVSTIQPILCGGTLIAPDIVLTAAHCGGGFLAGVNVGGLLLDGTDAVETLAVDAEFPHPDYDEASRTNDIMLVKLTNPSTLSPIVQLNFDPAIPAVDDVVTVIGFGDTVSGGDPSSELLTVTVNTFSDDFCFDLYNSFVPETMICAGTVEGGRDSCQGDSGGPLLTADNVQVGVVSNGNGCGLPNIPAIYTEVAAFESYIREGICST
jgi:trypsin